MALFDDPFDGDTRLSKSGCSCGKHASQADHEAALEGEALYQRVVASGVMRALFPEDTSRRAFLKAVGAGTAAAAVSQFLPLGSMTETSTPT